MAEDLEKYIKKNWIKKIDFKITKSISASRKAISSFRSEISAQIADIEIKNRSLFLVALDEVLTNIAEHGLDFNPKKKIKVIVYVKAPDIVVCTIDQGTPFDPRKTRAKSPKRQFAKGADGGYGMFIYKRVFTEIEYNEEKKRNIMVLYFNDSKIKLPA